MAADALGARPRSVAALAPPRTGTAGALAVAEKAARVRAAAVAAAAAVGAPGSSAAAATTIARTIAPSVPLAGTAVAHHAAAAAATAAAAAVVRGCARHERTGCASRCCLQKGEAVYGTTAVQSQKAAAARRPGPRRGAVGDSNQATVAFCARMYRACGRVKPLCVLACAESGRACTRRCRRQDMGKMDGQEEEGRNVSRARGGSMGAAHGACPRHAVRV
eukprot:1675322-Prymnesium_polylepis.1